MRRLLLGLGLLAGSAAATAGVDIDWGFIFAGARRAQGNGGVWWSNSVATDAAGFVYACTHFFTNTTMNGQVPLLTSYGNDDFLVTKQAPDGSIVWGE